MERSSAALLLVLAVCCTLGMAHCQQHGDLSSNEVLVQPVMDTGADSQPLRKLSSVATNTQLLRQVLGLTKSITKSQSELIKVVATLIEVRDPRKLNAQQTLFLKHMINSSRQWSKYPPCNYAVMSKSAATCRRAYQNAYKQPMMEISVDEYGCTPSLELLTCQVVMRNRVYQNQRGGKRK